MRRNMFFDDINFKVQRNLVVERVWVEYVVQDHSLKVHMQASR